MSKIIYCADAIVHFGDVFVVVERLGEVSGLALPGGKKEKGETLSEAILRELFEETGLTGVIIATLGTCADDERDPRGRYVTTVFEIVAHGTLKVEVGKTRPRVFSRAEIEARYSHFAFDHAEIFKQYFARV